MAAISDRDTGFCSGGDDDEGFYSHTDASDDSGDVKVRGVSQRNKRKCSEPRRLDTDLPAKKRKLDSLDAKTSPFRPWSEASTPPPSTTPTPLCMPVIKPWANRVDQQLPYPLAIPVPQLLLSNSPFIPAQSRKSTTVQQDEPLSLVSRKKDTPQRRQSTLDTRDNKCVKRERSTNSETMFKMDSILSLVQEDGSSQQGSSSKKSSQQATQRNYKNMTRERRIEANARERTRVHTISAAFDTLRHAIPAYSHNQKLSKLSVLRIACSYIVSLSRLTGQDYSVDQSSPSLAECVTNVTSTIQTEGKVRKKKDE